MSDLISRQAAIDALEGPPASGDWMDEWECGCRSQWEWDKEAIENVPSAQPQRMRGRWLESNLVPSRKGKPDGRLFICSECNKGWVKQDRSMKGINFCPHCGAEMGGTE